jgi:putative ABC transport system substrate-binding protein
MKRRTFIAGLGSAATWPLVARAQQATMPVVGYLYSGAPEPSANFVAAFRKGLGEIGYVEGRNVAIEYRWARNERLPELAADLVRRRVDVIASPASLVAALAAKAATTTIPIVFATAADPVQVGLVDSLNHPGGNVTGVATLGVELAAKRLELLHELTPTSRRFAALIARSSQTIVDTTVQLQAAASVLGGAIEVVFARNNREIDTAFDGLVQNRTEALWVGPGPLFNNSRVQIVTLAKRHALPTTGVYTGRILKGEKPTDLPVMQPTKFDLVTNLKTAKALGLTIPETLLATADEVIQ